LGVTRCRKCNSTTLVNNMRRSIWYMLVLDLAYLRIFHWGNSINFPNKFKWKPHYRINNILDRYLCGHLGGRARTSWTSPRKYTTEWQPIYTNTYCKKSKIIINTNQVHPAPFTMTWAILGMGSRVSIKIHET